MTQPLILTSSTGADFLATLPTLAGYTARNSVLLVPFTGKRTIGALRLDLPMTSDSRHDASLTALAVASLSRLDDCDRVMLVFYTDEEFAAATKRCDPLRRALAAGLDAAGFGVMDAFCVASDAWASWMDADAPHDGRPLSDITDSPLAARAAEARAGEQLAEFDADARLPDTDPAFAELLTDAVDALTCGEERSALGLLRPAADLDPLEVVEEAMGADAANVPVPVLARLVVVCNRGASLQVIVQTALGAATARRLLRGASRDQDEVWRLLFGETRTLPSRERLGQAIALLRRAVPHVGAADVAEPLAVLAWMTWAVGRASVAQAHVSRVLALDPQNLLGTALAELLHRGQLPEWIYTAHSAAHRRGRRV